MKILITGTAGFIGFHLAKKLVARGDDVVGLDSINDYYDQGVKYGRLEYAGIERNQIEYNKIVQSTKSLNYRFIQLQLEDKKNLDKLFEAENFDAVCNLAAQAGVRYSIENPIAYIDANIVGFINILEACRHYQVDNLSYASSSSVYGLNESYPFSTSSNVDHPMSLYAASKKSNELMAHTYSHLYGISTTGLRFFTVYGPWGRPDMALFLFTKAALEGRSIKVFNNGEMLRDFTYVDDIVEGITRVIDNPAQPNLEWSGKSPEPSSSSAPYKVYNIGNNNPVKLMDFIQAIENTLGKTIEKELLPLQAGDVPATYANVDDLVRDMNYQPATPVQQGIDNFIAWYREFFKV
ncbi:NAD-dependent epimerase [Hydrogenovibrio sp. JE_KL2]|uniref:NAD-dependent epimerase n=1 Tax=Hydrogenovibrio sp. JE_KL2 TaxID=2651188 RepID=UPI00128D12E4|nr:NAD-dependent epimerase [Hydrogenovibrio sp. JE_KL2]MPQ75453.1 NAD-dependent epimerase [Hydrogenovibrio sp. JE_KL2]